MRAASTQAVILAAGRGSRMGARTAELPKALLPIGPRSVADTTATSFLRRQVELLQENGVDDIVIVVGYRNEIVGAEVQRWGVQLHLVVNDSKQLSNSGSLHSLQYAIRSAHGVLDGTKTTLFMDADIVYHRDALRGLLNGADAARSSALQVITARVDAPDDEAVRVYGSLGKPRFIGKGLRPALVAHATCLGEASGIVRLATKDHELARDTVDWLLAYGPARTATEHEELSQRFMSYGRLRCAALDPALPCMECDDEADYQRLREVFYPALLRQEALATRRSA